MKCDIIIPVWNQLQYTKECLNSLFKSTSFPFRLIVIDNASDAPTAQYLDSIKERNPEQVILIRNSENLGWVKAVNEGISCSDSPYVCVMNNDTVVYSGWLSEMAGVAEKDKSIGIVNPLWEVPKRYRGTREDYFSKIVARERGKFIETDWVRGFCFLIKREVINKIGGLDEAFSPGYYDDWDYSARATKAGFKCVRAKGAFVWHYISTTYPEVLGAKGAESLFQDKGKVFYQRWGRPLRGLLIVDSFLNQDPPRLKNLGLKLLRDQNKLFVISSQKKLHIEHTSCTMKYSATFMLGLRSIVNIIDNFRHSLSKRYDFILCSPRTDKLLRKVPFIKNNYLIKQFDSCSKNEEDLIKDLGGLKKYE
jgi:glycosyltransferase involved in cell wall biosynthesis